MQLVKKAEAAAPERTPEREALATAIIASARVVSATTAARDSVERGRALLVEAEAEAEAAVVAVASAREADAADLAKSVRTKNAAPVGATKKARQRAEAAADAVEVARAALATLEVDLANLEEESRRADMSIEVAINAVLAGEAIRLVDDLERLKNQIPGMQSVLYFIRCRAGEKRGTIIYENRELAAPLAEVDKRIMNAIQVGLPFNPDAGQQDAEGWAEVCAALRSDPDAALPG